MVPIMLKVFLVSLGIQVVLGSVIPKATNIPNYSQIRVKVVEDDNIQLPSTQQEVKPAVAPPIAVEDAQVSQQQPLKDEQHLPQIPIQIPPQEQKPLIQKDVPEIVQQTSAACQSSSQAEGCNSASQPVLSDAEQTKLLEIVVGLQLSQKLNELNQIQNLESELRNVLGGTGLTATLGLSPGVTSESGFNLFGGANNIAGILANAGIVNNGNGLFGPILTTGTGLPIVGSNVMGVVPTATGNLLAAISTVLNNMNTPINSLIASVGPTGTPILTTIGTNGVAQNGPLGVGTTGTGILGTSLLANLKPASLLSLLSALGLGGNVALSGGNIAITGNVPTVTGGIPVGSVITNRPSLAVLLSGLAHGVTLTGLRSFDGRSTEASQNKEMPWLVSIVVDRKVVSHGVLVSDQHVLTIATPLLNVHYKDIQINLANSDRCSAGTFGYNMSVTSILANSLYNPQTKSHDLALLKLSRKLDLSGKVLPICLPSLASQYIVKEVTVPTWNPADEVNICESQTVQLPLMTDEACSNSIDPSALLTSDKSCMEAKMMGGRICHDVVGTPVHHIAKDGVVELLGLVSNPMQCGKDDNIYFVRVQDHLPWLLDHIKDDTVCIRL